MEDCVSPNPCGPYAQLLQNTSRTLAVTLNTTNIICIYVHTYIYIYVCDSFTVLVIAIGVIQAQYYTSKYRELQGSCSHSLKGSGGDGMYEAMSE